MHPIEVVAISVKVSGPVVLKVMVGPLQFPQFPLAIFIVAIPGT
jgi:hypothetical protein